MGARIFAYCFIGSFATACLLLLAIAVGSTVQRASLAIAGSRPEGTVVAKRPSPQTKDGVHQYAPVVQFTAGDWPPQVNRCRKRMTGCQLAACAESSVLRSPGLASCWWASAWRHAIMAIIFGWVALFGQASGFSGGVGNGGAAAGMGGGVPVARIAFGALSAFASAASLWSWKQVLRRKM